MQVSQVQDHVTHAVIGGKQTIDFGISNSPEFFNILSSTLYKDQILAVVREVLCNAWDAHIEAGCTDKPVQITLDSDKFTIKDFGKGIHHDDMGLIYGTYGNSTKKNDGNQTGGFGLGCKAPFAYIDYFEVISCHEGTKTIYNLSKSSQQAMGKPGIIPIASVPTEDTGLTVSIRIKPSDYLRFKELVDRIVHNGDMNMAVNGKQVDTLGFDMNKGNYLIMKNRSFLDFNNRVMLRYGNVIYPVDSSNEISQQHKEIAEHLKSLGHGYVIVFQAPPHSISVTPSRESLSMQEHTINTLQGLFDGFLRMLKEEFPAVCSTYTKEVVAQAVTEQEIGELTLRTNGLPRVGVTEEASVIADLTSMADAFMRTNYPKDLKFRKEDITHRLHLMMQNKLVDQGKAHGFLRALKRVQKPYEHQGWHSNHEKSSWLQREVIAPLLGKLCKAGLDTSRLFICDSQDQNSEYSSYRDKVPPLVHATKASPKHLLATLPYLRNILVLTSKRHDLVQRTYDHEDFGLLGKYEGFLVYNIGKKKGEADAARAFFAKTGMRVIDLTLNPEVKKDTPVTPRTPRNPTKKGLVCLSSILNEGRIYTPNAKEEKAVRILDPEFVVQVAFRMGTSARTLPNWTETCSHYIVQLFGSVGGITTTLSATQSWISKGAKPMDDYVLEKVCSYLVSSPTIKEYWGYHPDRVENDVSVGNRIISCIFNNRTLMKEFGLVNNLTEEDKKYLYLFNSTPYTLNRTALYQSTQQQLDAIPLAKEIFDLIKKLDGNTNLDLLDCYEFQRQVNSSNPVKADKAIKFLALLINN